MKSNRILIALVMAIAMSLSVSNDTSAQDASRNRSERDSDRTAQENNQNREQNSQDRASCSICGLTVEKANGDQQGLKIVDVVSGSPADEAGLEKGDVLISVDDESIDSADQLKKQMMQHQRQSSEANVRVKVRRDDRNRQVTLTLDQADRSNNEDSANDQASLGVTLDSSFQGQGRGVRISSVYTNSPADRAGLKTGDRILKVDGKSVSNVQDVVRTIQQMNPNESAELTVIANGEQEELDIQLTSRAETIQRAMVDRGRFSRGDINRGASGYPTNQTIGNRTIGNQSTSQFRSQNPQVGSNESLTQVLTGIRQELQQLRQQIKQLENNRHRDEEFTSESDRNRNRESQQNRYGNDESESRRQNDR